MSVITPGSGFASDDAKKAVSGWKSIQNGQKIESRKERIARERREGKDHDPEVVTKNKKRQALLEAQRNAEEEIENPMKHLRESYKRKRKLDSQKRKLKLNSQKTLTLLTEVTEKGGEILGVSEAGFDTYVIEFLL